MSFTYTPAHATLHPDRFEDETTGFGYSVHQDTGAEDPRSWIGDDEKVAVYVFNGPRGGKDSTVPDNLAAQAFAHFYELWDEEKSLAATRRWLTIFRDEKYDLAISTIRGYSQSDWAEVFAASVIDREDGTPGYGPAQGHIDQYASWRWGNVWTVSTDEGESLSGIYAPTSEEALTYYRADHEPPARDQSAAAAELESNDLPEPDFMRDRMARWHLKDGVVVADNETDTPGIYFYDRFDGNKSRPALIDPLAVAGALRAAAAFHAAHSN